MDNGGPRDASFDGPPHFVGRGPDSGMGACRHSSYFGWTRHCVEDHLASKPLGAAVKLRERGRRACYGIYRQTGRATVTNTLEKQLLSEFQRIYVDPQGHIPISGFRCEDGWFDILYDLSRALETLARAAGREVTIEYVKEKFGELRCGCFVAPPIFGRADPKGETLSQKIFVEIEKARRRSTLTCEICGKPGFIRRNRVRHKALCDACL